MKRIYHTWDKWECYPAGFYESSAPHGISANQAIEAYRDFLADIPRFEAALQKIVSEWKNSCEHYLSNENMNRIAWLGQAAMCIDSGIPSQFRAGYNLLSEKQKLEADEMALKYLNKWLVLAGEQEIESIEKAQSKTQANLY
jgi:hypothetical protein